MAQTLQLLAVLTSPLLFAGTPQDHSVPIGMVLQVQGEVSIERGETRSGAILAALLYAGDRVITAPGSVTLVLCPSSEKVTLQGEASVELQADGFQLLEGVSPLREQVRGCALPPVALGSESLERVGALRLRGLYQPPDAEYPAIPLYLGGPITRSRPFFQWGAIEEADSYHVTLRNERGSIIWEHTARSERAAYPQSAPPLEENRVYLWEVRAHKEPDILEALTQLFETVTGKAQDVTVLARQSANFMVRPNLELAPRAGDDPAAALMRAIELESRGYFAEAADYFRELRKSHRDDTRLTRHLAWLYGNAGLPVAADKERESLDISENK